MNIIDSIQEFFAKDPGYSAVRDRDAGRDPVTIERKGEDELLKGRKRLELISSQRENFRNTTFSPASALQLQTNVIGTVGGKLTVIGKDGGVDETATSAFRRWARHAEFTRGLALNELLRLLLTQLTHTGGDFIAVFDDGILTGADNPSMRVKIFEPDQIKNIDQTEFDKLYPPKEDGTNDFTQLEGIVRDKFGRIAGAFVGNSRKSKTFGPGQYLSLRLSVPGDFGDSNWIHVGTFDRPNQQRGVAPLVHVANTLSDLAALQGSEVQAAKLNAALGIIVKDSTSEGQQIYSHGDGYGTDEIVDGETFSDSGDGDSGPSDEDAENLALTTARDALKEGQSAVMKLAYNKSVEAFKTDRPNINALEMYDRLIDVSGTVLGLTQMFTRLKPQGSYSAARSEFVLVRPVFTMWQKSLERNFLDWLAVRALGSMGFKTTDGLETRLLWSWPVLDEVDEGSNQTALQKKFLNGEVNLIDLHGADVEKFLDRRAAETKMFKDRGLTPPWEITVSGGQIVNETDPSDNPSTDNDQEKDPE